ncbi:MAG: carboxypeptidase regulatory-like domain-containing protein [Vicinamibacterales bacterium]
MPGLTPLLVQWITALLMLVDTPSAHPTLGQVRTPSTQRSLTEAAQHASGAIRGRVDVRRVARATERRPEVAEPGAGGPRDLPEMRRGVVFLEAAPRGAFEEREPGRAVLDQRNETFVPHVLAITMGTTVEFPNSDNIYHNVFSLSKPQRFDLGRYATGKSKSVRFDRPGVVRVFCDIHSHMNAFILVFSHRFFDVTEADGRFTLSGVPPGTYNVVAWYEGETRSTRPVTVMPGTVVDLDFVVP